MKLLFPLLLPLVLASAAPAATPNDHAEALAPPASGPLQRFALVIGSNDGGGSRVQLRYAGSDAKAMARVLRQLGGLESTDETVLLEPRRAEVLSALFELGKRVAATRAAGKRTEVLVYYSGHSDDQGLLPAGELLSYADLRTAIDRLGADVRIAILDSCSAGAFTRRKGGSFRPPFLLDDSVRVRGHAFLASSSASEAAQESERIRGSFFTHYLVTGLRGAADASGDGLVTLNEAYAFAFKETLAGTEKTLAGAQHPAYDIEMAGTGDVVMTDLHQLSAVLTLPSELSGRIFLRDASGALAAELSKTAGGSVELGLEPGPYLVLLDQDGTLRQTKVEVAAGRSTLLPVSLLTPARAEVTVSRGSSGAREVPFNLAFLPPLSINALVGGPVRNRLSLALLMGYSAELSGVSWSGVAGAVGGRASGLVASGVGSYLGGPFQGVALSGVVGLHLDESRGLLAAGVLNYVNREGGGFEAGGVANVNRGDFAGLQAAGVLNVSRNLRGAQVGLVNYTAELRGLQLGLVNVADSVESGLPVGLVSVVRHGGVHSLELAATDATPLGVMLKLGTPGFFTVLGAGLGRDPFRPEPPWTATAGLGTQRTWSRFYLEGDLLGSGLRRGGHLEESGIPTLLTELRLVAGWRLFSELALFAGPSWHLSLANRDQAPCSGLSQFERVWVGGDATVRTGPGFVFGVRAF